MGSGVTPCVVVVPYLGHIRPACEAGLRELERREYPVWRIPGHSDIARGRSMIATSALHQGFDEIVWIDSDIAFAAEDVERLRSLDLGVVGGIYPQKGRARLCVNPLTLPTTMTFGPEGGLVEVAHLATGFLLTRRKVYEDIRRHFDLPRCGNEEPGIVPYFLSIVDGDKDKGYRYLSEDFSFCERARTAGHTIWADTTIRLGHVGDYHYTWEDASGERDRFANYTYTFNP